MEEKRCIICNYQIPDDAEVCPRCKTNLKTLMPRKPSLLGRFGQWGIGLFCLGFGIWALVKLGTGGLDYNNNTPLS